MKETKKYDSDFCGNLPIHIINVIQPYSALIVVNKSQGEIIQVSENITQVLDLPVSDVINRPVKDFFPSTPLFSSLKEKVPHVIPVKDRKYYGFVHNKPAYYVIELNLDSELDAHGAFIDVYQELRGVMQSVETAETLSHAADLAAAELKNASGFDKVMIYKFDDDWNGHVLAESKDHGMESYLNFTFPASDIPKPARDLYEKNAYRFIPDTDYKPVKLFPVINPVTNTFLDLSDCNARGVSAVHVEYLSNMKVKASMSTRIMKDGKLWGLIACHHKSPMKVNYKTCAIFELLSGIFSSKLSALEIKEKHQFDNSLGEMYTSLVEETYRTGDLASTLLAEQMNLLSLFSAAGAVITRNDGYYKKGKVPDNQEIDDLLLWLHTRESSERVFVTDRLPHDYEYADEFRQVASGLISIPLDSGNNEFILVFRPENVHVINWGGDPATRLNFEEDMKTYHPRFSFKLWQEKVKGISLPWRKEEVETAENLQEFAREFLHGRNSYKN